MPVNAAFCAAIAASSLEDEAGGVWADTIGESRPKASARAKWPSVRFIGPPDRAKGARRFPTIRFVVDTAIEGRGGPDRLNRIPRRLSGLPPGLVLCNFAR